MRGGRRMLRRRAVGTALVVVVATALVPLTSTPAGAQAGRGSVVLNDSPAYAFTGAAPLRNAPMLVATLRGEKEGASLTFEVEQVVSFVAADTPLTLRLAFYSRSGKPEVYGGVQMPFRTGSGSVEATLVERASEGTATTAEVWEEADEVFATFSGELTDFGVSFTITPKGSYRKLLRDPLTAVGFDLSTDSGDVQPSVRVSIGDLLGTKPGLLPTQGTAIAADGSPQPWITRPISADLGRIGGLSASIDGSQATFDAGRLSEHASQLRLFIASPFTVQPAGSGFPPYDLVLWGPDDTSVYGRSGDAFRSTDAGIVDIVKDVDRYALELYTAYRNVEASAQAVVPGIEDAVLLATGFRARF